MRCLSRKSMTNTRRSSRRSPTSKGPSPDVPLAEIQKLTQRLISSIAGHFAHEERLMRAARYASIRWHKQAHDHAGRRVGNSSPHRKRGFHGRPELVEYLTSWLNDHTRLADRMMGAFLRNQQRCMWKLTFRPARNRWMHARGSTQTVTPSTQRLARTAPDKPYAARNLPDSGRSAPLFGRILVSGVNCRLPPPSSKQTG